MTFAAVKAVNAAQRVNAPTRNQSTNNRSKNKPFGNQADVVNDTKKGNRSGIGMNRRNTIVAMDGKGTDPSKRSNTTNRGKQPIMKMEAVPK